MAGQVTMVEPVVDHIFCHAEPAGHVDGGDVSSDGGPWRRGEPLPATKRSEGFDIEGATRGGHEAGRGEGGEQVVIGAVRPLPHEIDDSGRCPAAEGARDDQRLGRARLPAQAEPNDGLGRIRLHGDIGDEGP